MEKSPAFAEKLESEMSDAALAKGLISEIGGDCMNGKGAMLDKVYQLLLDHLPDDRAKKWTRRRVRGLWGREAAKVEYREMTDLARVSEAARQEREMFAEARKSHAEYIRQTAAIAAFLERQDPDFHRPSIEGLGCVTRGMDCSRDQGD